MDARKEGLKNGLRQLTIEQLIRVKNYKGPMCLDTYNFHDYKYCPLAIGLGLDKIVKQPSHDKIFCILTLAGYSVYNTRGIDGKFYTGDYDERKKDLLIALDEVLKEKQDRRDALDELIRLGQEIETQL